MVRLEYAAELVEEAVFLALRRPDGEREAAVEWERTREPLYRIPVGAERELAFQAHARSWFAKLQLADPIELALRGCPRVRAVLSVIDVRRALRLRDETSELFGSAPVEGDPFLADPRPRRMILGVQPSRFLDAATLGELALRELLHAEDTLDPAFGFDPSFAPELAAEPARRELLRDRFRVLWEARIRGRMSRAQDPTASPPEPSRDFRAAFGAAFPAERTDELFSGAWSGELSTQAALMEAALHGIGKLVAPPAT